MGKKQTPEEIAAENAHEDAAYKDSCINYVAEHSRHDRSDVANIYAADDAGLKHHFNMISGGRQLRGFGIVGAVLFGALSVGGVIYAVKNDNLADLPYFSAPLAALSVLGIRSGRRKIDAAVELVDARVEKLTPRAP